MAHSGTGEMEQVTEGLEYGLRRGHIFGSQQGAGVPLSRGEAHCGETSAGAALHMQPEGV